MLASKGYFKMDDGTKSTDPSNAHLIKVEKTKSVADEEEPESLQPKRAITSYMHFSMEFNAEIRATNPDVVMPFGEVSKLVSERWNTMTEDQKKPFEDKFAVDKLRQEKQVEELNKMGYFLMVNGSKSTDVENVPKKRKSLKPTT
jgi:hypothetical protein